MIHTTRGRLTRVVVAATLATGALAAVGALSSQAGAASTKTISKTVHFHIFCNLGTLGNYNLAATLSGTYPSSVKSGSKFSATKVHGAIIVPETLDNISSTFGKSYEADLKPINANSSDATPKVINGAGKGIIVKGNIKKNQSFKLNIPQKGTINVGPWKAGKKGTDKITFGTAGGSDSIYSGKNQSGVKETTVMISCRQPSPTVLLATVAVS